jgi:hypothetical protein
LPKRVHKLYLFVISVARRCLWDNLANCPTQRLLVIILCLATKLCATAANGLTGLLA